MKKTIVIELEFWADSFHEGDWACQNLIKIHKAHGGHVEFSYKHGFLPIYKFYFEKYTLIITVYGSYKSWAPLPESIADLIIWGKPDLIIYDPVKELIILAVEETAAVPTGNQALQRCERLYGSAQAKIPFWYLLAEYGLHKDGSVRRDSIWPSIMAIKLTMLLRTPSIVLHYADVENPEGYDFGTGVSVLFNAIYRILLNRINDKEVLDDMQDVIKEHYEDVLRFIDSQHEKIIDYLPGTEFINTPKKRASLAKLLANLALTEEEKYKQEYTQKYADFLVWPLLREYSKHIDHELKATELLKYDPFCSELENAITGKKAYTLGSNAGSRPQKKESITQWINEQSAKFLSYKGSLNPVANFSLDINDFPKTENGNHHMTTAKNIIYLFDKFEDVKEILERVFPRLKGKLGSYDDDKPTFIYISNSMKPGRIFGDPFTGQISAYSVAFGKYDVNSRYVIAYYPHQSFTQMIDDGKKKVKNKGFFMLREMTDLIIFGGGVGVYFNKDEKDSRGKVL